MSTLWLHCGAHKTATTSLQKVFGQIQPELHRLGYTYLAPRIINSTSILADLHAAPDDDDKFRIQRVRQFFAPIAARRENVLVSHESLLSFAYASPDPQHAMRFYGTVPNALTRLQQSKVFDRVILILYIRRQDHYQESIYFEELKQGSLFPSFEDYLEFRKPEEVSWIDLVETLGQFVPPEEIVVRPFESIRFGPEAFLRYFLEILGWPKSWDVPALPKLNARPSELAHRLHLRVAPRLNPDRRRWLAIRLFRTPKRNLPPARPCDEQQSRHILARHVQGNRAVFSKMPEQFQRLLSVYGAESAGQVVGRDVPVVG